MKNTFCANWLSEMHPDFLPWLAKSTVTAAAEGETFTLASGQQSDYYLDLKSVLMQPRFLRLISSCLTHMLVERKYRYVSGMETAAIPLVAAVCTSQALLADDDDELLNGFYLRKGEKTHGTKRRIEWKGDLAGQRVAILEDVVTTGGSSLEAVRLLREAGAVVEDVFTIVDREAGGEAAFSAEGVSLTTIYFGQELLTAAKTDQA